MAFAFVITMDEFSNVPLDVFLSSGEYSKTEVELAGIPFRMLLDSEIAYQGLYLGDNVDCLKPLEVFSVTLCSAIEYRQENGDWLRI